MQNTRFGDPEGSRGYHAQWPFVTQVGSSDELLWVAEAA
jgi:hypothetical protein